MRGARPSPRRGQRGARTAKPPPGHARRQARPPPGPARHREPLHGVRGARPGPHDTGFQELPRKGRRELRSYAPPSGGTWAAASRGRVDLRLGLGRREEVARPGRRSGSARAARPEKERAAAAPAVSAWEKKARGGGGVEASRSRLCPCAWEETGRGGFAKFVQGTEWAREGFFAKFPSTADLAMDGRRSFCAFVHEDWLCTRYAPPHTS
jgi:hypothetical protein